MKYESLFFSVQETSAQNNGLGLCQMQVDITKQYVTNTQEAW